MSYNADVIVLDPADNTCIAARPLAAGAVLPVAGDELRLLQPIKMGHKIALRSIAAGDRVLKYGQTLGFATATISAGEWVHSHNVTNGDFARDPASATDIPPPLAPITDRTFQGYRRANGKTGTRNYIAILSAVNCSASVSKVVAQKFSPAVLRDFPNVDGVVAFRHGGGCGLQYDGPYHKLLDRCMGGIAKHPNIGAYLIIGLGCENASIGHLLSGEGLVQIDGLSSPQGPPVFSMQDLGGTTKTIEAAVRKISELLPRANEARRTTIPASEILLGTNCGGSDGNSGVTANPALGVTSDMIVACGGTSVLGETTEIWGAEHLLTRRARTPAVAKKLLDHIDWWLWYTGIFGAKIDNNPSVGNKEGGLTTITEKSLGAVAKAGSTAMEEVYAYGEEIRAKGMVVMDTPGLDPVSVTGIVAGGANVFAFTTGRGSCFGCKPTPSIKIATNTPMYERMVDDMDINAGEILTGGKTIEQVGREIFEKVLAVAGGEKTKSELHGYGDEEFVPWPLGPTL